VFARQWGRDTTSCHLRFHETIKKSLERRKADVVELSQGMTESMADIHHAIIQCMTATLAELKRSNTSLDLDDLTVENAYFKSFSVIVRKQLDPVWHKVGPKTKQLVSDLATLRNLLYYLLTYDAFEFNGYLDNLIESNTVTASGGAKVNQSPWTMTDAAHVIFDTGRRRCFTLSSTSKTLPTVIDVDEDEDAWEALNEAQGIQVDAKGKSVASRPGWLPSTVDPVLEELPKWELLTDVLQEIEEETVRIESMKKPPPILGSNTVLIMASSTRTCNLIKDFLATYDPNGKKGAKGRTMMMRRLRMYLWWKGKLVERKEQGRGSFAMPSGSSIRDAKKQSETDISEALQKKDREKAERNKSRRRMRGGAPASSDSRPTQPTPEANSAKVEEAVLAEL
jgi:DNA excision repair protein ERCC-4